MTSKIYSAILAGTAVLAVTLGSTSAHAATEQATARARILAAVTLLNNNRDLQFGTIVSGTAAGTIAISNAGARTACTGAGVACSGTVSAALFDVTGTAGESVTVNIDSSVDLTNGTDIITADLRDDFVVALDAAGAASFGVGGTLSIAANQPDGDYVGQFTVDADYQ